jgi:hypothetical protein
MCSKIINTQSNYSNLLHYYRFDNEVCNPNAGNQSNTITDYAGTAHGMHYMPLAQLWSNIDLSTSSAPIGDVSAYQYNGNTSTASTVFGIGLTDTITATLNAGTNVDGIHVYGVHEKPNTQNGQQILDSNNRYAGVFVVGDTNAVSYTMQYAYPLNPAVVPVNNSQLLLFKRMHNAIGSWTLDNTATNDTTNNHYITIGHNTEYMLGYSQVPLAINDLNFDILKENTNAKLNWNVTTIDNINNFEVLRSTNGITFTSIAKVNISNTTFYTYTDANLLSGQYYYKIKLNDINKQSTYSTTRQIEIENAATVQVYPNPATTAISIATTAPKFEYSIRNALGQIVYLGNSATNNQTINIQSLSNGIYTINIKTGLTMQVVKFTKQ